MIIDKILFRHLLDDGEKIMTVAHVHPWIVYPQLFKVAFFGIIMPAGAYFLFPPLLGIWAVWGILGVVLLIYRFAQWYMDAWIVTNVAVIDHVRNSPFDQVTNRIEYGNIDGITNEVRGFWGTVLRYGKLQITHVNGAPLVLNNVASPRKLERFIMQHQQTFVQQQNFDDHAKLKDLLTKLLRSAGK